jgi:hypothetical protein
VSGGGRRTLQLQGRRQLQAGNKKATTATELVSIHRVLYMPCVPGTCSRLLKAAVNINLGRVYDFKNTGTSLSG